MISKHNLAVIEASAKGYYVDDEGEIISPKGIVRKCKINKKGYKYFNIKVKGKYLPVYVHKLCAYKKYGYLSLLCDCVRHLDSNPLNNKPNNINIDIVSVWNQKRFEYQVFIVTPENAKHCYIDDKLYLCYEEAAETAIKYCLENLI